MSTAQGVVDALSQQGRDSGPRVRDSCELTSRALSEHRAQRGQEMKTGKQGIFQKQMYGAPLVRNPTMDKMPALEFRLCLSGAISCNSGSHCILAKKSQPSQELIG